MPDEKSIEFQLGKIVGLLESVQATLIEFGEKLTKNDEEHKQILDKLEFYALKKDVDSIAERVRSLEENPSKQKAALVDRVIKWVLTILGTGVGLYLLINLKDLIGFISKIVGR